MGMDWKECTLDSSGGGSEKDVVKIFREGIQNIATGVREAKKGCGQHIWTRFQKVAISNCGTKRVGSRQWENGSKKCCRYKGTKEGCGRYIRTKDSKVHGLVSHVIQGSHQDQSVARLDKKLEGHATWTKHHGIPRYYPCVTCDVTNPFMSLLAAKSSF